MATTISSVGQQSARVLDDLVDGLVALRGTFKQVLQFKEVRNDPGRQREQPCAGPKPLGIGVGARRSPKRGVDDDAQLKAAFQQHAKPADYGDYLGRPGEVPGVTVEPHCDAERGQVMQRVRNHGPDRSAACTCG